MLSTGLNKKKSMTSEEAERLVREYQQNGSLELRNRLVLYYSYIVETLVVKMNNTYHKYASSDDMVNQGVIAIIECLERFDPGKNVKFSTYAFIRVRGAIIDFVRKQDWLPRYVREESIRIQKIERELTIHLGRFPTRTEIAKEAGITIEEYDQYVLESSDTSLGSFETLLETNSQIQPSLLPIEAFDPQIKIEEKDLRRALAEAVDSLKEQERTVLSLYYYENLKMKEISQIIGVTEQRVGQINKTLLSKLRDKLSNYVGG